MHAYQTHAIAPVVLVLDARGEAAAFWACHLTHAIPVGCCDCGGCRGPVLCNPRGRASSDSSSPDSIVAPYFANSRSGASTSSASSDFAVAAYSKPEGRASPADLAIAVAAALTALFALEQEDPASPAETASSDAVGALRFEIPRGPSFTSRPCACCHVGTRRAVHSKPRRSIFARRPREFGYVDRLWCGRVDDFFRDALQKFLLLRCHLVSVACGSKTNDDAGPECYACCFRLSCFTLSSPRLGMPPASASSTGTGTPVRHMTAPKRQASTLSHLHDGPFQHGTQAGTGTDINCSAQLMHKV